VDDVSLISESRLLEMLGISRPTAWRLRHSGELPYLKVRGRIRYRPKDVQEFIQKRLDEAAGYTVVDGERCVI
jgi:excisionase family DNA binding protein